MSDLSLSEPSTGERSGLGNLPPRALIVTVYGLYAREAGGWLGVRTLVRLMAEVEVEEAAVRSSISRLKRRGILLPERLEGRAGYALSEHARGILDEGDRRIFSRERASLDDGWVLAMFSVPESQRQRRHVLRSRLAWLGFGSVSSGVWIAPRHLEEETREALARDDLLGYVDLFHATFADPADLQAKVATWWDLTTLSAQYSTFDAEFAPLLTSPRRPDTDARAFADYVRALTAWRRLPFLDPGLPTELLPDDWAGMRAEQTFVRLSELLGDRAHDFVASLHLG
ncbi:MAG: PaaX family transcriptional regulator C-terminal domain-containing protein [Nocardioides sp.]